jgi:hypothetical protein
LLPNHSSDEDEGQRGPDVLRQLLQFVGEVLADRLKQGKSRAAAGTGMFGYIYMKFRHAAAGFSREVLEKS